MACTCHRVDRSPESVGFQGALDRHPEEYVGFALGLTGPAILAVSKGPQSQSCLNGIEAVVVLTLIFLK